MIIRLELQICIAVFLDLLFGDPRKLPHPVRGIGWAICKVESLTRRLFSSPGKAGVLTWFIITGGTCCCTLLLLRIFYHVHPLAGDIFSILTLYTTIAARDLMKHGRHVKNALQTGGLEQARERLSMIVTRDTGNMSRSDVVRSTVESISENISDGIVAPLFFAFIGGAPLAMFYKAVNTLDSMVGYRNERYLRFGWFSARADDLLNLVPARLTGIFLWLSALLPGLSFKGAGKMLRRDRKKRSSPNAGWPESAAAGALGLRFGGEIWYFGKVQNKPFIGDKIGQPEAVHITKVNRMLCAVLLLTLACGVAIRYFLT